MAEDSSLAKKPKIDHQLTLRSGVCSIDIKDQPDVAFKDKETNEVTTAHRSVLSQASPFFNTWFKEQWQKVKATTEYPVPGDIDWEVFTNVIAFLYGKDIQFEEEALPKIYNAADFLQLENLKMAIVVSLTDQWELKDSSIKGAMCTAIAPHTDPRVVSGLLYMVSVRYLIRNIPTIMENDDIDISSLPLDTVMEIAQSEEVAAPEIQLYHFLRKWTEKNHHKLSIEQTQNLFSHVRYATIPHIELETITKYFSNNNHKLWSALGSCPSFDQGVTADIKQLTNRKCQENILLLNSTEQKKWTQKMENATFPIYTVISHKRERAITITWPLTWTRKSSNSFFISQVNCKIHYLSERRTSAEITSVRINWYRSTMPQNEETIYTPSASGLVIRTTSSGVRLDLLHDETNYSKILNYTHPHPWLLTITTHELEGVTVQTW